MKNSFKISAVFVGSFVGAGFASGQEILQYFVKYGYKGIFGAVISAVLFFIFCFCSLSNVFYFGAEEYLINMNRIYGIKQISVLFMILLYFAMITAAGETIGMVTGLPDIVGAVLMAVFCSFVLLFGGDGIVRLNLIITPLIILGIFFSSFFAADYTVALLSNHLSSSVIYISYNVITLVSVSAGLEKLIINKKTVFLSSLISSVVVLVLILCMFFAISGTAFFDAKIPILCVFTGNFVYVYTVILIFAMITTAVANGYGIISLFSRKKKMILLFLCIFGIVFSVIPFSFTVKYLYSFFGYFGIIIIVYNLWIFGKDEKNDKKT